MWEVATLGNIPTSIYFVTCVAFSGCVGSIRLNNCIIKQENEWSVQHFLWNFIPQSSCYPAQDG